MSYYLTQEDYLMHHGVKGQKWGNRQYQYEDGSLTPLGRVHYGYGEARSRVTNAYNSARASIKSGAQNFSRNAKDAYKKAGQKFNEFKKSEKYEKVKKYAKIGAAVAGTALAAYGAYKISQMVRNKRASIGTGENLFKTQRFQETLNKKYNNIIGMASPGKDYAGNPELADRAFKKQQALREQLSGTNRRIKTQETMSTIKALGKSTADKARAGLKAGAQKAQAGLKAGAQKAQLGAKNALIRGDRALKNAKSAAKLQVEGTIAKAKLPAVQKLREEINGLTSRASYYESRMSNPQIDAESRAIAGREFNKLVGQLKSAQAKINALRR